MALENYVKFLRGTHAQYNALTSKDKDTLYFISDDNSEYGVLYLGSKIIAGGGQSETITLDSLKDITIASTGLEDGSLLVYDIETESWVNQPLDQVLQTVVDTMTGATDKLDGKVGLVPAPKAGEQNYFLRGDGSWAKVASESQIFEVIPEGEETHLQAIVRVVGDIKLNSGNIAIVKKLIANEKYEHTAYVFDGEWKAMSGNYNAENVYFDEDLLTTTAIGVIELENGQATIPAAGKNLKEVFNAIFVKEENPETIEPSVSVSLSQSGYFEVGKTVSVDYTATFNDGSYGYGPEPTGAEVTAWSVSNGISSKTTASGSFDDILITDNTAYRISATATYTEGSVPSTNTGNPYEVGKIAAGSKTGYSSYIRGFRPFFYGMDATDKGDIVYNSAFIRNLTNGGKYDSKKTLKFTAAELEGVKRFVVAIPSDAITSTRTGIVSATITSSLNADALEFYKELETTIEVQGADNYATTAAYRVWVYEPTSIAAEEIHEVVLE